MVGAAAAFGVSKASTYMALHPASKLATSKFGVSIHFYFVLFGIVYNLAAPCYCQLAKRAVFDER